MRSGNSTPEISPISEDGQMFSMSIALEPVINDISGIGGIPGRASAINLVGFNVDNPKMVRCFNMMKLKSLLLILTRLKYNEEAYIQNIMAW